MTECNNNRLCLYVLPLYLLYSFFNAFISKIINIPSVFVSSLNIIRLVIYIYILYALFRTIKKFDYKIIFLIYCIIIALLLSNLVFMNKGIPVRFNEYVYLILSTIIPLSISVYFSDKQLLLNKLSNVGFICGYIYIFLAILALKGIIVLPSYDMSMGYCVIVPMACLLYEIMSNNKLRILKLFSLGGYIIFTVVFASRGPLVSLAVLFCYLLFFLKNNFRLFSRILLIILIALSMIFYVPILKISSSMLNKVGIRSRTIELIVNNDIYHSSGRENLYSVIKQELNNNPFAIRGIASETEITYKNQYAHNMYLEILYQFGVFVGLPFLILISLLFLKDLRPSILNSKPIISIFLIISVVTLQFSSSIWLYSNFWIWLSLHLKNDRVRSLNNEKK